MAKTTTEPTERELLDKLHEVTGHNYAPVPPPPPPVAETVAEAEVELKKIAGKKDKTPAELAKREELRATIAELTGHVPQI